MKGISNFYQLNGHVTRGVSHLVNKRIARALTSANFWSSSENNSNNSWTVYFASSGYSTRNTKYYSFAGRAVAALDDEEKASVMEAYDDCCRDKMGSADCVDFRLHAEEIIDLALEVKARMYEPGLSDTFIVTRPKLREIFAAHFKDRIVQHWIYLRLIPLFEERFNKMGNVSYNCRKNFGTLAARQRVYDNMHFFGFAEPLYVGKFDIASYFMSIDINVLWQKLEPFIQEKYQGNDKELLLYLTKKTIFHRPQKHCIRKGNLDLWSQLQKSKSLFGKDDHTGMAIGNLTTQTLCNFYLSYFDEWLLARIASLGYDEPTRHYLRFVDDFVLHSELVQHITLLHRESAAWMKDRLHLELHPKKVYIQPQRHGVSYVGGVIKKDRVYIINRTVGALKQKARMLEMICQIIIEKGANENRLALLEKIVSSMNSYSGFLVHGNTYNIQCRMLYGMKWFWEVCYTKKNLSVIKIRNKYKLSRSLLEAEERRWRIMASFMPRRKESFPDEHYLRQTKPW